MVWPLVGRCESPLATQLGKALDCGPIPNEISFPQRGPWSCDPAALPHLWHGPCTEMATALALFFCFVFVAAADFGFEINETTNGSITSVALSLFLCCRVIRYGVLSKVWLISRCLSATNQRHDCKTRHETLGEQIKERHSLARLDDGHIR